MARYNLVVPRILLIFSFLALVSLVSFKVGSLSDGSFYEMRVYYANPRKLDDLNARFRNHTTKLFEKHGMTNIGYWTPIDNPENKLIYVLSYPNRAARDQSWNDFMADPEWKKAAEASEREGKLVARVESVYMKKTDFSPRPAIKPMSKERVFELRTYTAKPGRLDDLLTRFRDHTVKLFTKHGMEHIEYWVPVDKEKGSDDTLIYILAHESQKAGEEAFNKFREDKNWIKAKAASEANGPLTASVESVYMVPTDYSKIK
ncbi:hypothetical protein BH23BAC1_BH23BAC1_12620 [soil metagenome]